MAEEGEKGARTGWDQLKRTRNISIGPRSYRSDRSRRWMVSVFGKTENPGQNVLALVQEPGAGYQDIADRLDISLSTAHQAVQRLIDAGLADEQRRADRQALLKFLLNGVRFAFFANLGPEVRGVPTSHSAPPLSDEIVSDNQVVWPSAEGSVRGSAIAPLYPGAPALEARAPDLYRALTLVDALRIGRAGERFLAAKHLNRWLEIGAGAGCRSRLSLAK